MLISAASAARRRRFATASGSSWRPARAATAQSAPGFIHATMRADNTGPRDRGKSTVPNSEVQAMPMEISSTRVRAVSKINPGVAMVGKPMMPAV